MIILLTCRLIAFLVMTPHSLLTHMARGRTSGSPGRPRRGPCCRTRSPARSGGRRAGRRRCRRPRPRPQPAGGNRLDHRGGQRQEHPHWAEVGVVGDVGPAGLDGASLQPGEGDGEGDAHGRQDPGDVVEDVDV